MATRRALRKATGKRGAPALRPSRSVPAPANVAAPSRVASVRPATAGDDRSGRAEFSEAGCLAKTGRASSEWFRLLDEFNVRENGRTKAASHLMHEHGVQPWWAQAITVQYERNLGLRSYGQRHDGFAVSVQRAMAAPVEVIWRALCESSEVSVWYRPRRRQGFYPGGRWSNAGGDRGQFRRIVPGSLLRFTWENPRHSPGSAVQIEISDKGGRCTLKVTHRRIGTAEEREELRLLWSRALDSLKSWVETGAPVSEAAWRATHVGPSA